MRLLTYTEEHALDGAIISVWLSNLPWPTTDRSIVILGPAGIGKTTYAIKNCLKPALLVSHMDTLSKFKIGYHKSIIFDDVDINHLPLTAQIHLVDREKPRCIHMRYTTALIPAGVQKIFTANEPIPAREDGNIWPMNVRHGGINRRVYKILIPQ